MWKAQRSERFVIDLNSIQDDMTIDRPGWSFLQTDPQNFNKHFEMIVSMLSQENPSFRDQEKQWKLPVIQDYLHKVDEFKRFLLFCVHVTGGNPPRASEILSLRFRNTQLQMRNVFVYEGQVMILSAYYKDIPGDVFRSIHRFLPWRVGQLLVL